MARHIGLVVSAFAASCLPFASATEAMSGVNAPFSPAALEFFETRIRPVLAERCGDCHWKRGSVAQGGLRLDSRETLLKGGDSGPAIVPGDPDASLLVRAIQHDVDVVSMPPGEKVETTFVADIRRWIRQGAAFPENRAFPEPMASPEESSPEEHWAFVPPVRPAPVPKTDSRWPRSTIDQFAWHRMRQKNLQPSLEAAPQTLARRLHFDLLGLPPSYDVVQALMAGKSDQAYLQLVDRLLASPHFGERWARHWMDIARFADTRGYVFQQQREYTEAYTYRDWLIKSLNEDLPYDQFLMYQLAADQLPRESDAELAAMGYLTLGRRFLNNGHDIIDDRIDVVTRGMLSLTVTCARCHDHKYDPIPTEDYYSLYGVFASSQEPGDAPSPLRLVDSPKPQQAYVFLRGDPRNRGPAVPRQFLEVLCREKRSPFREGSGRLELARAITSRDNPLTSRVLVNRVWQHLFGVGLVRTPSDFGQRSTPPSQPEVLDLLAVDFMADGWSVKRLIRRIVLSKLYRQRSDLRDDALAIDPENRLVWRMNRRRLDFEAMRDALLQVAGQLDATVGGPSVEITKPTFAPRRTLYGFLDRQNLPKIFRTFDFASPDTHAPRRFQTTVPQQALLLMNSPWMMQVATGLVAVTDSAEGEPSPATIGRLYQRVYARDPTREEIELGLQFLRRAGQSRTESDQPVGAWPQYAQVLMMANEFVFLD